MELDTLTEAIDALAAAGPDELSDRESIVGLQRQLTRLEAVVTGCMARFDEERSWVVEGAKTSANWFSVICKVPRRVAQRRVALGKVIAELPVCAEAYGAGELTEAQARAICSQYQPSTAGALERDQELLLEMANSLGCEDFSRWLSYWKQEVDPAGAEDNDDTRRAARYFYLDGSTGGNFTGKLELDPISGSIVSGEINRLEKYLFKEDWAQAKERLGRDPLIDELDRTNAQRRADALVEMATRSRTAPADGIRPAPLFSVLVGYETLYGRISEIENGTVIAPSSLIPFMEGAYFERALFGLGNRIDVSVRARLFTGGTRRAIELRDRMCTHEICFEPAERCQADHIKEWAKGGETTQENGRLLCGFHNRLRNQDLEKRRQKGRPPPTAELTSTASP
jgi:hypothetical protein